MLPGLKQLHFWTLNESFKNLKYPRKHLSENGLQQLENTLTNLSNQMLYISKYKLLNHIGIMYNCIFLLMIR